MPMKNVLFVGFVAIVLNSALSFAQQNAHDDTSTHANLYLPTDIQWKEGPPSLPRGAKVAVLEGDPAKEGMFVMRVRVPDGFHIPAHTHPKPERVTVIQGKFKLAMGDKPKLADARILVAGTYG